MNVRLDLLQALRYAWYHQDATVGEIARRFVVSRALVAAAVVLRPGTPLEWVRQRLTRVSAEMDERDAVLAMGD